MADQQMDEWIQSALETDRNDLLELLQLRFTTVTSDIEDAIRGLTDLPSLERLILVAANVPNYDAFAAELAEGVEAFRIVGSAYDPLATSPGRAHS